MINDATERRLEQLRRLTEISRTLTYTTSLEQVLELAVDRATELLDAPKSLLMLADSAGLLQVRAARGIDAGLVRRFREPLDETVLDRLRGMLGEVDPDCFLGVPLVAQGEVVGILAVVRTNGTPCSDSDEWLLSALADQAAVALENARLSGEVKHEFQARIEKIQDTSDAREKALTTLSHDLRTPLNAIDSYAELLEMGLYGPVVDRQLDILGRIRLSGRHLLSVLENVMEMARLSAGVIRFTRQEVPVSAIVRDAVTLVHPQAIAKEQALTVEIETDVQLTVDSSRLRQVLVNLLGNAAKYTPRLGTIVVQVDTAEVNDEPHVVISVTDTGPGIQEDMLEEIFEPYSRVSATAGEPGVGLGLTISRELIRRMGGDITVSSEKDRGSTFTVSIPLA